MSVLPTRYTPGSQRRIRVVRDSAAAPGDVDEPPSKSLRLVGQEGMASSSAPSSSSRDRVLPCASGCGFAITWHTSHCCKMCLHAPGEHGTRCDRVPLPDPVAPGRSEGGTIRPISQAAYETPAGESASDSAQQQEVRPNWSGEAVWSRSEWAAWRAWRNWNKWSWEEWNAWSWNDTEPAAAAHDTPIPPSPPNVTTNAGRRKMDAESADVDPDAPPQKRQTAASAGTGETWDRELLQMYWADMTPPGSPDS